MITAEEFVLELNENDNEGDKNYKLAKVVELFENETAKIKFDGEDRPSEKQYAYLSSYSPKVDDRILLAAIGGTYIILGKIKFNESPDTEEEIDRYLFDLKVVTILKGMEVSGNVTFNEPVSFNKGISVEGNAGINGNITTMNIVAESLTANDKVDGGAADFKSLNITGVSRLRGTAYAHGALDVGGTLYSQGDFSHRGVRLGFYSRAPLTRRSVSRYVYGTTGPTLAGLTTKINELISVLQEYGLIGGS